MLKKMIHADFTNYMAISYATNPYLVVGVGRCGTSTVAQLLHEKLNICMGTNFDEPAEHNPGGFFEDMELKNINKCFFSGMINYPTYLMALYKMLELRMNIYGDKPWGFKDPNLATLLGFWLPFFEDPRIIYCTRNKNLVVKSFVNIYDWSEKQTIQFYDLKTTLLERTLKGKSNLLTIDFADRRLSDEEIISLITDKWRDIDAP